MGSRSKPLGQVGAPISTNARAKYSGAFSGSTIGPPAARISEKSRTPSLPSVKRSHKRWPSSARRRSTSTIGSSFVCIGASDLFQGQVRTRTLPIIPQFGVSRQSPLPDQSGGGRGQFASNDLAIREPHDGFCPAVARVEMRRLMIVVEHLDHDAVEPRNGGHFLSPSRAGLTRASTSLARRAD